MGKGHDLSLFSFLHVYLILLIVSESWCLFGINSFTKDLLKTNLIVGLSPGPGIFQILSVHIFSCSSLFYSCLLEGTIKTSKWSVLLHLNPLWNVFL